MSGNGELMVSTSLRGFHFYSPICTNIASGQEMHFRKQPQSPYDGNAIGGFVRGLDELDRYLNFFTDSMISFL